MRISYYIPLGYLYRSRLRGYRGVLGFTALEIVPLGCVLLLVYHIPWILLALMFAGYLSCYECGQFWNDSAESASEIGGDRLQDADLNFPMFVLIRALLLAAVSSVIYRAQGATGATLFAGANICLFLVLVIHTSRRVRAISFLRLVTFSALACYKYAPVLISVLPWTAARQLLLATFACYGFPRVLIYAVRKYGNSSVSAMADRSQALLQLCTCVVFVVLFVNATDFLAWRNSGVLVLWLVYTGVSCCSLLLRFLRGQATSGYENAMPRRLEVAK